MTRRTRRRARRTLLAAIAALGVGTALLVAPPLEASEAAWQDPVHGSGTITALTLAQPQPIAVSICNFVPLNTSTPQFAVQWRWPVGTNMPSTSTSAAWTINGTSVAHTTSGPVNGIYTTSFSAAELRDIAAPIAGATYQARASTRLAAPGATPWTTPSRAMATMSISFLLIESCTLAG